MGIKYGFCAGSTFKGRRLSVGKSTLMCGNTVKVFSSGMSGETIGYFVGMVDSGICNAMCDPNFFATSVSGSSRVDSQPVQVGCCADSDNEMYLIDAAAKCVDMSREYNLTASGQGTPEAAAGKMSQAITVVNAGLGANGQIPSDLIQTEMSASIGIASWEQGSATWIKIIGIGNTVNAAGTLCTSGESSFSVNVSIATGVAEGQKSRASFWGGTVPCTAVDLPGAVSTFAGALQGVTP